MEIGKLNRTLIIQNRNLSSEENFIFFDSILQNQKLVLSHKENLSILLSGLTDFSEEFTYTSELLDLIRDFKSVLEIERYIFEIFQNIEYVLPHGKHWYIHLLIDVINLFENGNNILWRNQLRGLSENRKTLLIEVLLNLKSDVDYKMEKNATVEEMLLFLQ